MVWQFWSKYLSRCRGGARGTWAAVVAAGRGRCTCAAAAAPGPWLARRAALLCGGPLDAICHERAPPSGRASGAT
eukprot:5191245-Pyramimonas_sp.AAC.1